MPTIVEAKPGDTLCGLAIAAGFLDCDLIRKDPANAGKEFLNRDLQAGDFVTIPDLKLNLLQKAVEALHKFVKKNAPPVLVRFTHGSPDKPYRQDKTETHLNVSNWPTDKAGKQANKAFPKGTKFQKDAHDDPDAFKIEVVDPKAGGTVEVELRVLKPVFKPDKTIDRHEPFSGADAAKRLLKVTCESVPSKVCFRSPYLRLVVDEDDQKAAEKQTLLVKDVADGNGGDNDLTEILDYQIQASYTRQKCPAATKCTVRETLNIGNDRKHVRVAANVLKDASGTAVAPPKEVRRRILNYVRQLYAQADMTVKLLGAVREVPLPANLLAVANADGKRSTGNATIKVRVRLDGTVDVTATIQTRANVLPIDTANDLAAALRSVLPAGTKVEASANPPLRGQAIGSADILVGAPLTQKIRLNVLTSDDVRHPVTVGALTSATVAEFGGNDSHVGTIEERVLVKNYDSGSDRIDLFIVDQLGSGSLGEAFTPNFADPTADTKPTDLMTNSALVFGDNIRKDDHFHTTIPHELGHILMDVGHANLATEMMGPGSPKGANERVVDGPKRISDPREIVYSGNVRGIPVQQLRENNSGIVE
ncbi:MAG TPA: hypothetical protein DCY13_19620 [Verrucomicrobiales bacterium]|nr:hypothetical protein [Verrucomicrobiales bacterium]